MKATKLILVEVGIVSGGELHQARWNLDVAIGNVWS